MVATGSVFGEDQDFDATGFAASFWLWFALTAFTGEAVATLEATASSDN